MYKVYSSNFCIFLFYVCLFSKGFGFSVLNIMYSVMDALVFFHLFYAQQVKRTASNNTLNSNQYTPAPYLDNMLQNSQNSESEAVQLVGLGSTIGSAFGPIGTAVGGFIGGILCLFVCDDGKFCF